MSNALLSLNWLNFFWPMCAMGLGRMRGYWLVLLLALAALPVRGLLAAAIQTPWVLIPVQILDGVGAGLLGVAVPGLWHIISAMRSHLWRYGLRQHRR